MRDRLGRDRFQQGSRGAQASPLRSAMLKTTSTDMGLTAPAITSMTPHPDAIADCVLSTFDSLPEKRKPRARSDGAREWVPLAGIVLAKGTSHTHYCSTAM